MEEINAEDDGEKDDNEDNVFDLRAEKLMNSKDNSRNRVTLLFLGFAVLSILPFLLIFGWEYYFINRTKFLYNHLE